MSEGCALRRRHLCRGLTAMKCATRGAFRLGLTPRKPMVNTGEFYGMLDTGVPAALRWTMDRQMVSGRSSNGLSIALVSNCKIVAARVREVVLSIPWVTRMGSFTLHCRPKHASQGGTKEATVHERAPPMLGTGFDWTRNRRIKLGLELSTAPGRVAAEWSVTTMRDFAVEQGKEWHRLAQISPPLFVGPDGVRHRVTFPGGRHLRCKALVTTLNADHKRHYVIAKRHRLFDI